MEWLAIRSGRGQLPICIANEARLVPEPDWTLWRWEKSLVPLRESNHDVWVGKSCRQHSLSCSMIAVRPVTWKGSETVTLIPASGSWHMRCHSTRDVDRAEVLLPRLPASAATVCRPSLRHPTSGRTIRSPCIEILDS